MPILAKEISVFPESLFSVAAQTLEECAPQNEDSLRWWAMYTRSRHEKQFMRKLLANGISFYCPTIERRYRSSGRRVRSVFEPLFSNYVFVFGSESSRYTALTTNCLSQCIEVVDGLQLTTDLAQLQRLIEIGEPLSPESRLLPGERVRVRTGLFAGFEGIIIRREADTRLLVAVNFMQQGASVQLDDCQLDRL